jgi:hypothetical protein
MKNTSQENDAQRDLAFHLIGRFIHDFGMVEVSAVESIAALMNLESRHVHFLLKKTGAGQKFELLREIAKHKNIDVKDIVGPALKLSQLRNMIAHNAVARIKPSMAFVIASADLDDKRYLGKRMEVIEKDFDKHRVTAMDIGRKLSERILIPSGRFKPSA